MSPTYLVQPYERQEYLELFRVAADAGRYTTFCAAVAYATVGGVRTLDARLRRLLGDSWDTLDKRWLVGIDWCRSDPPALEMLDGLMSSKVRVPNGELLSRREDCRPDRTFHPKLFLLSGPSVITVIAGSGNLSLNGMTRGCECGSTQVYRRGGRHKEPDEPLGLLRWFEAAWRGASRYEAIALLYEQRCQHSIRLARAAPTDDDAAPTLRSDLARAGPGSRALSAEQRRQLRSYRNFWIEAGALGANYPGRPIGNQLDMSPGMSAFFGFPPDPSRPQSLRTTVDLIWDKHCYNGQTLKFGGNGMDKLNVPPARERGVSFYRDKVLLFTRVRPGVFQFTVGAAAERRHWSARSQRLNSVHHMRGGRAWGMF